jgi:hypothetical protein
METQNTTTTEPVEDASELIYCADGDDYEELKGLIRGAFPAATFEDGSDDIHEYRFSVDIPGTPQRDFWKFAVRNGFALACFGIQLARIKTPGTGESHAELVSVLEEVKREREAA